MANQTAHGSINIGTNSAFLSEEVNRTLSMAREDLATLRKGLFAATPLVFNGLTVSPAGTGLGLQVAAGEGVDGAGYPIYVPATKPATAVAFGLAAEGSDPVVTLDSAHPSLPRIDLVYLRSAVLLTDFASIATNDGSTTTNQVLPQTRLAYFTVGKVTGTPSASPVAPVPPLSTDLVLAQVNVPAEASSLSAANVMDRRALLSGIPLLGRANTFSALQTFTNGLSITGGTITGDGSGLSSLNASRLVSGTLNDGLLSGNVPLKNTANTFTLKQTMPASATGGAGFNLPHGAAPAAPVNGDVWTTTAGAFARINGGSQAFAFKDAPNTFTSAQDFNTLLSIGAGAVLPAASLTGKLQVAGLGSSPDSARLYWGDGSGWRLTFATRAANTDTIRHTFTDRGEYTATGKITAGASGAAGASLSLPPGTAPTTPLDGDVWRTSSELKARIGSATYTLASYESTMPFVAKQTFPAATASSASINIPSGLAPSSPVDGDIWAVSQGLRIRSGGATYTAALLEAAQTYTAKRTFATPGAGNASINLPHGVAPASPVDGDVWTTAAGAFARINGESKAFATADQLTAGSISAADASTVQSHLTRLQHYKGEYVDLAARDAVTAWVDGDWIILKRNASSKPELQVFLKPDENPGVWSSISGSSVGGGGAMDVFTVCPAKPGVARGFVLPGTKQFPHVEQGGASMYVDVDFEIDGDGDIVFYEGALLYDSSGSPLPVYASCARVGLSDTTDALSLNGATASTTAIANKLAQRDASGVLYAVRKTGTGAALAGAVAVHDAGGVLYATPKSGTGAALAGSVAVYAADGTLAGTASGTNIYNILAVTSGTSVVLTSTTTLATLNLASPAFFTFSLPNSTGLTVGYSVTLKDKKGDADVYAITVNTPDAKLIDGSSTFLMSGKFCAATFAWDGSSWNVL